MTVCQLDTYILQPFLSGIDICVTFCLCEVHLHRLGYMFQITKHTFDFINCNFCLPGFFMNDNAVCTAFHLDPESITRNFCFQTYLSMIIRTHASLYLPMQTASHQHCFFIHTPGSPVIDVSAS